MDGSDYVPDLSWEQVQEYRDLLARRAQLTRQITAMMKRAPKVPRPMWNCLKCGHSWKGYFPSQRPKYCSKCNSPYWQTPRRTATVFARQKVRDEALTPVLPRLSTVGLTPPPVVSWDDPQPTVTDDELTRIGDAIAEANRRSRKNLFVEDTQPPAESESDASRSAPLVESPSEDLVTPASEQLSSGAASDGAHQPTDESEGPRCCSRPTRIDGICINCGDGVNWRHGHQS